VPSAAENVPSIPENVPSVADEDPGIQDEPSAAPKEDSAMPDELSAAPEAVSVTVKEPPPVPRTVEFPPDAWEESCPDAVPETVDVHHRSTPEERDWLRRTLAEQYDTYAGEVLRLLSKQPGLRAVEGEGLEAVVTDLVAVHVYLSAQDRKLDAALRSGKVGLIKPYAGCVVSGLRRLPSHRGIALHAGTSSIAPIAELRPGSVLSVPTFLNAVGDASVPLPGDVEYLLWSFTGRRVADIPQSKGKSDRILFAPGARFKVLDLVVAPAEDAVSQVLLREVIGREAAGMTNQDRPILDRLRPAALTRSVLHRSERRPVLDEREWMLDAFVPLPSADDIALT
jgi:hypothetical protein